MLTASLMHQTATSHTETIVQDRRELYRK